MKKLSVILIISILASTVLFSKSDENISRLRNNGDWTTCYRDIVLRNSLFPPGNLSASLINDNDVLLNWLLPSEDGLYLISYHDNIPDDGYYQLNTRGYGVVFNLEEYPDSVLEYLDFHHRSWDLSGPWSYKIHIIDWQTRNPIVIIDNLETMVSDTWELSIPLNSTPSVNQVGIFMQPLGNTPSDAFPVIDLDENLDYFSYVVNITNYTTHSTATGDFLMNLWITTGNSRTVQAPKKQINTDICSEPGKSNTNQLTGFNIYRDSELIESVVIPDLTTYTDKDLEDGLYSYYVTAVYGEEESIPSNIVEIAVGETENLIFFEDFEAYEDFALEFDPWITLDLDGSETYGFTNNSFPNEYDPMAFIIFNPSNTTPPLTNIQPFSGSKMAASFASTSGPNNDWLISPVIKLGTNSSLRFWAKSQTAQYGLERLKVGISTEGIQPENFTFIQPYDYISVPVQWTLYEFCLQEYSGTDIRLGFNCVSNDSFVLYVDHIEVFSEGVSFTDPVGSSEISANYLRQNYPNPFNPLTNITFSLSTPGHVNIDVFNLRGQKIITLVDNFFHIGSHTVSWNGKDSYGQEMPGGIYFYRMTNGQYCTTKKMILMK